MRFRPGGLLNVNACDARPGFTLAELLTVIALIFLFSGSFALKSIRSTDCPETEAKRLAHWLSQAVMKANRLGRAFTFFCNPGILNNTAEIRWHASGARETLTAAGCRFIRRQPGVAGNVYSPQWNTVTPALTVRVTNGNFAEDRYVVVSVYGRIRISSSPLPDM